MALTQSARLPGPSWDEEVVPALRKRLESESRTLARRISGISLSSVNEVPPNQSHRPDTPLNEKRENVVFSIPFQKSAAPKLHTPQNPHSDRNVLKTTIPRVNGSESSSKLKFERTRTYSSPYASGLSNGQALPNGNTNASKSTEPPRTSVSTRPSDVKPTRIPKAARGGSLSNGYSPHINGHGHNPSLITPPSQPQSPGISNQPFPEQRNAQRGVLATPSTRTKGLGDFPHQGILLLNESPPFTSISSMSSYSQHGHEPNQTEDPPRSSIDSEEKPFEHWYRGEVSRNGGVGEFRVGRRQEMLDIANYGHAIKKKKKPATTRVQPINLVDEPHRYRKRADSIGGMTDKEREERGSLYLDDEHAGEVGRVLDESPLTDLDGEGSDINSESEYYNGPYAYIPEVEDDLTPKPEPWTPTPGAGEARSLTPASVPSSMIPPPSSRQQQQPAPPTRIPTLSTSRRSSDSRKSATSPTPAPMIRGASEPPQLPSSSKTPSPPATSSSSKARQQTHASNTLPTSAQKMAMPPASKKSRTTASKATRTKASATRKEQDEELNRKSVAYYPTPSDQGDDNMADAIPSWTQPVHGEGNWDEVILPVVARKKGLDGHYESADGSPLVKKAINPIAPAPGTFGYKSSKYRPPRSDYEPMMDEFGQRSPSDQDQSGQQEKPPDVVPPTMHEVQKPRFDHRVAPFADSDRLPPSHLQSEKEEEISESWFRTCAHSLPPFFFVTFLIFAHNYECQSSYLSLCYPPTSYLSYHSSKFPSLSIRLSRIVCYINPFFFTLTVGPAGTYVTSNLLR